MGMLAISKKDNYFVQRIMINLRIIAVDVMEQDTLKIKKIDSYVLKILHEDWGKRDQTRTRVLSIMCSRIYFRYIGYAAVNEEQGEIAEKSLCYLGLIGIAATDSGFKATAIKSIQNFRIYWKTCRRDAA